MLKAARNLYSSAKKNQNESACLGYAVAPDAN